MRLGGCLAGGYKNVDEWLRLVKDIGYKAVTFPLPPGSDRAEIMEYVAAMRENDITNAEVGAWSNPLSDNVAEREAAMRKNIDALQLAEETGALCCVNIAGSRNSAAWDGPQRLNLTQETFDMTVKNTQAIIDAVKPVKTKYTLETMPWIYPESPESYLRLMEAINRDAFGVHLDICNTINCPERYFGITGYVDHTFDLLGEMTVSIHLKDVKLGRKMTVHIDEVQPGEGEMDFKRLFERAAKLRPGVTMIIEHLGSNDDYAKAFKFLRGVITDSGLDASLV
ncbi:MAG: sugar phosphate isomerase/epimerase [Lachnospiraceae bacterium]|nr:sugar phosphate isomerase/epimerase [Lachnospiraceae bacterium]